MVLHLGRNHLRMQSSAGFVNVAAVWTSMCNDHLAAKIGEQLRSDSRSGTIRAVNDYAAPIERKSWNSRE